MDFEACHLGKYFRLAILRKREDFRRGSRGSAARVIERALRIFGNGPEIRNRGAVELFELRREGYVAITADREVLGSAPREFRLIRLFPDASIDSEQQRRRRGKQE